jgi:ssDNA-binding Zn-finger/Zn-ribbon topoisomerase 1
MDLGQILIGALLVLAILYVVGRRSRASTASVFRPTSRPPRSGRQPLTRLEDVVPIPAPEGWPTLPPEPAGLDGEPEARPRVELADRPYDRTTCPTCSAELDPLPKAKKRCPACSSEVYVRSGPDDRRYLLTAAEASTFQERWTAGLSARYEEARVTQAAALTEWHARLRGAGLAVGPQDLDVVGESFYHAALAGIRAALHDTNAGFEVRVVALIRREPENKYDRNAIAVYVHGAQVGHLDRCAGRAHGRPDDPRRRGRTDRGQARRHSRTGWF